MPPLPPRYGGPLWGRYGLIATFLQPTVLQRFNNPATDNRRGLLFDNPGERARLDFPALTGKSVWVYGQTEVVKDLVQARLDAGLPLHFEVTPWAFRKTITYTPRVDQYTLAYEVKPAQ